MKLLRWVGWGKSKTGRTVRPAAEFTRRLSEACTYLELEEFEQARSILLQALQFRADVHDHSAIDDLLRYLGATWLFTEKYEEQIAFFTDYVSRHPEDAAAYHELGSGYWYLERYEEAIHNYSRALELDPKDFVSRSSRGQVFAEAGNVEMAMKDLGLALEGMKTEPIAYPGTRQWHDSFEAFVHRGLGEAFAKQGDIKTAMNEFKFSLDRSPENAWVYYTRARVYESIGSREDAISDYQSALMKNRPALPPLKRERTRLRLDELRPIS